MYKAGDNLGGCRLIKECGSGAFGSVFLAENETTHQRVALKILPKTGQHWNKELAALAAYQKKCRHANLMRIYHIGQNEDCIFYTMDAADPLHPEGDYVPDTLGYRLREHKRLEPEDIRTMLNELLDGLEILHSAGLLHRDIKPDNVLWVEGHAVLGDIGLVTEADKASFAGTRGFISPAVWKGERSYSAQDDLYALAMTLYCALTGNEPKGNLELPLSLTLSGCSNLIRVCYAILEDDSAVRSVSDFRMVLSKSMDLASKKHRKLVLSACLIALPCMLLFVFVYKKIEPTNDFPVQDWTGTVVIPTGHKTKPVPVQKSPPVRKLPVQPQKTPAIQNIPKQETPAKKENTNVRSQTGKVSIPPQKNPAIQNIPKQETPVKKENANVRSLPGKVPIQPQKTPAILETAKQEKPAKKGNADVRSLPRKVSIPPQKTPAIQEWSKQETPVVKVGMRRDAVKPIKNQPLKPHPVQAAKGSVSGQLPLSKRTAALAKKDLKKVSRLAEVLEREWRDSCRKRLKDAGKVVFSPLNLEQGKNSQLSYGERRRRAQEKTLQREDQIRREIEIEEQYQLPNLKSFAELAIRYFGDVAYNDDLVKKNKALLRDFDDPELLLNYYGNTLCSRAAFGLSMSWSGKLAELDKRLKSLPPEERRAQLRSIVFAALRRNYFNGKNLMQMNGFPVRSFPRRDEAEGRLSFFDQYIDRY